jgi:hypothetical protein
MLDSGPLSGFRNFDLPGTRTVVKPTGALAMASRAGAPPTGLL